MRVSIGVRVFLMGSEKEGGGVVVWCDEYVSCTAGSRIVDAVWVLRVR